MADHQDETTGVSGNDIAIIGMAGRFPGAADMRAFWRNLVEGVESISRLKAEALEASPLVPESVRAHPDFVPAAAVLEEGESFDAGFFDVPPREAKWMDPQQRAFLECAWAALEDAAYDPERYTGKIALYAGAGPSLHTLSLLGQGKLDPASLFELLGTTGENLATKASFKLRLRGESMAVYTACSTGLVAVHMACQSLLLRQSDMALAGAVRLSLPQRTGYLFQDGMILSPDGHCRAFDAKAAGTVPGNGVAAVVLKPLEDALRDGDHVYAVIRGSALNNDGGLKVGYTAPSVEGQADVIGEALAYAGLEAGDIGYVEAHGTGTALGDPIEVAALTRAYRKQTDRKGYCGLGSVKTNIGHLDTAAGLAGLMKAALALHHEELPPSLNFERPNPAIDFANSPFFVVSERRPWPRGEVPRRAGVSSFGIGGTNAHAVLEEAPLSPPPAPSARPTQVVTLSARTAGALEATARRLADWLERAPADVALADVAFTRNVGRRAFEHRRAVVAKDRAELLARLRAPGKARVLEDVAAARERRVAFLLPGQGAQSVGMGRELYAAEPAFREALDACLMGLGPQLETALRGVLLPAPGAEEAARETLADPRFALPALFCVEYALARLWEAYGVKPYALLGHSFGEYAAACLAGVMPLEDALALVAARGRLMARMPPGSMTAVGGAEEVVRPLLSGGLSLAAVNGPERCVVSGPTSEVEALERELESRGLGVLRLPAGHAFHSAAVEPLMEELKRVVSGLRLSAPQVPYVSSVTGTWIRAEEATDPAYWARQMRAPVRFGDGLDALKADGCTVFLEVGPDQALTALARLGLRGHPGRAVPSLPRAGAKPGEHAALNEALGALWEQGLEVRWRDVYAHEQRRRLSLPTYPFERQPFGLDVPTRIPVPTAATAAAVLQSATVHHGEQAPVAAPQVETPPDKAAPRTDVERKVLEIWRERLGRADFGIHDDFLELGGNSLMAAQMLTRLREAFPVQLPLSDLFEAPTVAGVAARIQARLGTAGAEGTEAALPPLVRIPRDGVLPLSVVQERVIALEQALPGNPALNMSMVLRMRGTLDIALLERSLEAVTRRHESLRTSYPRVDGRTVLRIAPELKLPLTAEPVTGATPEECEAEWRRRVHEETARPFDLERGPVVRARLLRVAADEHLLVVTVHHVVSDTWSMVVLGRELGTLYGALQQGQSSPLPELAVQYADYAAWQRKALELGAFSSQVAAWRERLVSLPGALDLPVDRPRGDGPALSALRRNVGFSRAMTDAVHALAQREGVTAFMVMLASWKALLARWAGRDDLVVGTPIGNRSRPELEPVIGYVAHAVPLRTDLSGDPTFRELLGRVRDVVLEAYAHPDVPYEHLVREIEPAKDPGRERVFDTLFVLHSRFAPHLELPGLSMSLVDVQDGPAQFGAVLSSLSVSMGEDEGGFSGTLDYAEERFAPETMERLVAHWNALLAAAVADPEQRLSALPLESGSERVAAPAERSAEPAPVPVASLLETQATRDAGAVALTAGGRGVAWGELHGKARRLAAELVDRGVGPEVLVAVCLEPSVERVAALWAVLEAGGAYVLLSVPQLRELATLAHEGGPPPLLLTHSRVRTSVALDASRVLHVDTLLAEDGKGADALGPAQPGNAAVGGLSSVGALAEPLRRVARSVEPRERNRPVNVSAETMVCLEPMAGPSGDRLRAVHTHRTVADLFRRLDASGDPAGGVWLAAEETHTPGSGLELLWALTRGQRVVLPAERARFHLLSTGGGASRRGPDFSLSFFANDEDSLGGRKYRLLLEAAKFADANGFSAVWTPERHFHAFGGLYPRPAVVGAGVASVTERVGIRAGSVVLPLHDPILVAEEWSVLDNLSDGRVGVSFASGWHANDFVFAPDRYARRKEVMLRGLEEVRSLWRGGSVRRRNGAGDEVELSLRPRPVQKVLPIWLTAAGNPETFRLAGELGAYVLTNLMGQHLGELAGKVALYREAWRQHGHAGRGHVSLMMHTYLGADPAEVRQRVRQPLLNYFRSSVDILAGFVASQGLKMDPRSLTPADVDALLEHGIERYLEDGGLFGTPDSCGPVVERVRGLDVDEVACLVDFGVEVEATLEGLSHLDALRGRYSPEPAAPVPVTTLEEGPGAAESLLALVRDSGATQLHCTATLARALAELPGAAEALRSVRRVLLEGATAEAAASLARSLPAEVVHRDAGLGAWMPSDATAWPREVSWDVVDARGRPVPPGVVGELAVAGAGVPRGFWNSTGSTSLRVLQAAEEGERRLVTGRRARRRLDGSLELLAPLPVPARRPRPPKAAATPGASAKKAEGPPPIPRVPRDKPLPLSFAQQRLWYLDHLEPGNVAYNNAVTLILTGALDAAALERALNEVVRRHEILRTTFAMSDSGAVQLIAPSLEVPIVLAVSEGASEDDVARWAREEARRPFDLKAGPLLRAALLRVSGTEHVLLLALHHIISDGWSAGVMMHELARLYGAFMEGQPSPLPALPVQYADYSVWQQEWMRGPELKAEQGWWRDVLADVPVLRLPTDRPRPPVQTYPGARLPFVVPRELAEALATVGRREGATPFMVLMAAWQSLLHVYSGQEDFAVGTPVAGRNRPEIEPLIGCFINSIALRADLSGDPTFTELLGRVRRSALGGFAHQEVPFEKLVDALHVARDLSHTPIFQTMLVLHNTPAPELALAGVHIRSRLVHTGATKLDLTLDLVETREGLTGGIEYNTDLFDADTISRLSGHLLRLLEEVAAAPERRLSRLSLLSDDERQRLLLEWNPPPAPELLAVDTVPMRFAAQVARTPDAVAVEDGTRKLTYREVDALSARLARHLAGLGVGRDTVVALALVQPADVVAGMLGVMRAGAAAVVLDVEHPAERLSGILEDTRALAVVTSEAWRARVPSRQGTAVVPLESLSGVEGEAPRGPEAHHAACIVYTSGSTGRPRGVVLEHRQLVSATRARREVYGAPGVVLSLAPFTFDASLAGLLWSLFEGGTLRYPDVEEREDPRKLAELMARAGVTHVISVPALYGQVLAAAPVGGLSGLRAVSVGGEACPLELARAHHEALPSVPLFNEYGPTEATIWSTVHRVRPDEQGSVPIGRAVPGARVYLLDARRRLAPPGAPGEAYVGGAGVARGYLGQPVLTAERFVADPFDGRLGARMYRTGDLARWRADGTLEFLGRADAQVKVRGFRIEPGEVEVALLANPAVKEAAVVAREDGKGPKRLVAYVVQAREGALAATELKAWLLSRLPPYMVPAAFVTLDALPRTRHGKVDTRALPAPERQAAEAQGAPAVAPRTEVEETLAAIWREVLNVERVGVHDDFFELGGDSILGLQIITRARAAGIELSPKQLFQNPTVARLATVAGTRLAVQAEQGPVVGPVALTPIQRWFFELGLEEPHHWNMSLLLEARAALEPALLERALAHVVEHHDALRLRFARAEDGWHQASEAPGAPVMLERVDLSTVSGDAKGEELERRAAAMQQSLRLEGPLVRAALLELGAGQPARLMLAVHHLAVDAVSWRILLEDLAAAYARLAAGEAVRLPPKTTSFQAWARGLESLARSEKLATERAWWLERPWTEASRLPVDFSGGVNTEATARTLRVALDAEETKALLHDVPKAWHTQPQDPLLTALAQALAAWTGRSAALVDVEGHGREEVLPGVDVSRTVGWFTRFFPALLDLRGTHGPGEALRAVKEGLRAVPSQGMGWGLLRYVARDTALAALPAAEVGFNHLGQVDGAVGAGAPFVLAPEGEGLRQRAASSRRPYLLDVTSAVRDGRLEVTWTFSEAVHRRETVARVAEDFLARLKALVEASRSPEAGGHSPSDFPLAKVKQAQLDKLAARFGKKTR
ncbi:non-ribosomal peptide synthetase/type I polyketide synthase [Myxococcus sp. RHSTA-1-4]|uniref:non-ribosomal peptide synthetase/type I polyketide synthase n=1 Tax=Myxococcus sp. RHSTA-1-4 TaxID=2874601 RepID=UPI001CBB4AD3|nr:non-ribosomal peptide synthetase/type I polyketide synthase [Myxococcus sp. RHSTA-1-4]MBZ4419893.1 amino acid adenylation domain-containing protein [Myxococcus sp. RHSTA-1-4]